MGRLYRVGAALLAALCILLADSSFSSPAQSFARAARAAPTPSQGSTLAKGGVITSCPTDPPCIHHKWTSASGIWKSLVNLATKPLACSRRAYDLTSVNDQREVSTRLNSLLARVVGQPHVITSVKQRLIAKLRNPRQPLVFLFTGDNGVGKTMTANLISLAFSLRCAEESRKVSWNGGCQTGDVALILSGTQSSIDGIRTTVRRIADHAHRYPNGVVIINEVFMLDPAVFEHLGPLFGRGGTFAGHHDVPLNGLTVILTSDFGKHVALTQGKTLQEVEQLSKDTFRRRFGSGYASELVAHSFLPLSFENALLACRQELLSMPCRVRSVASVSASDDAVEFIVARSIGAELAENNGRAVYNTIATLIDGAVITMMETSFPTSESGATVTLSVAGTAEKGQSLVVAISAPHGRTVTESLALEEGDL